MQIHEWDTFDEEAPRRRRRRHGERKQGGQKKKGRNSSRNRVRARRRMQDEGWDSDGFGSDRDRRNAWDPDRYDTEGYDDDDQY